MNYINIEKIPFQYSLQELPEGMKADCTGGVASNSVSTNQRRQLTVFTASAFSTIQPQTTLQTSGRGRKRSCPIKTELNVAVPGGTAGGVYTNVELQGLPPAAAALKQKIPRPPNAFMLFANDWRRKLASQFPKESNKDISIRLGGMWKNMEKDEKEKYFQYAREVDAAHKKKYPDYVYNPKEARMRKALREQSRGERQGAGSGGGGGGNSGGGSSRAGGGPAPWAKHRQIMNHRQPIMVGEQTVHGHHHHNHHQAQNRRPGDETAAALCKLEAASAVVGGGGAAGGAQGMLQNFNDYLSDLSSSYPAVVAQSGEFIVPDLDQSWYSSYLQGPVQNAAATYLMRAPPDGSKAVSAADEWGTHFAVPSSAAAAAADNTADSDAFISHNVSVGGNGGFMTIGTRDRAQQPLLNGSASGGGHHTPTHGMTSPAVGDKAVDIDGHGNVDLKDSLVSDSKPLLELSRIKVENGIDGNGNKDGLRLPGFQQAFGSTEIGRFSQHEGFFEASIPQPEAQPEPPKNIPNPVTPPRNKSSSDIDYPNGGSYGILSPSSNMSPSVWAPLLYSPTSMKDGASFGSPAFTHQSPLTNFIDYSLLSGTEFMNPTEDEIMDIPSSHCSNGYSTGGEGNSNEDKDLQILLATDSNGTRNANGRVTDNETMFTDAIQPIRRIIDIDNDGSGIAALRRKPQTQTERTNEILDANSSNNTKCNFHFKRIKSTDGFANQDLKMNCVNQPPVIISENEKICVILESSNVNLDSCNAANSNNRNKRFTNL